MVTSNPRWLILSRETGKMENSTHGKLVTKKSVIALHGIRPYVSEHKFGQNSCHPLRPSAWPRCFQYVIEVKVICLPFFWVWYLLPTHYGFRGLLLHLIPLSDTHTHTHTHSRTPLDDGSALRRDPNRTTHNTHKRHIDNPHWDSNLQSQPASDRRPTP